MRTCHQVANEEPPEGNTNSVAYLLFKLIRYGTAQLSQVKRNYFTTSPRIVKCDCVLWLNGGQIIYKAFYTGVGWYLGARYDFVLGKLSAWWADFAL